MKKLALIMLCIPLILGADSALIEWVNNPATKAVTQNAITAVQSDAKVAFEYTLDKGLHCAAALAKNPFPSSFPSLSQQCQALKDSAQEIILEALRSPKVSTLTGFGLIGTGLALPLIVEKIYKNRGETNRQVAKKVKKALLFGTLPLFGAGIAWGVVSDLVS